MKCTPDRIEPRIKAMRMVDTPYSAVAERLGLTDEELKKHVANILHQTGLKELTRTSLLDYGQRRAAAARGQVYTPKPLLTAQQANCLRLYAQGMSYADIAVTVSLRNPQTVQNHVSTACRALGIVHAGRHRLQRVQEHFAKQAQLTTPTEPDPMSDPAFN
jgi:DNA-binding NarL/FixJ family response regulator